MIQVCRFTLFMPAFLFALTTIRASERTSDSPAGTRSAQKRGRLRRQLSALALSLAVVLACAGAAYAVGVPAPAQTTIENTPLSFALTGANLYGLTAPTHGTATYVGDINSLANVAGSLTYTPNTGFVGTDTFTYEYCDLATTGGRATCHPHTMTVTVTAAAPPAPTVANGLISTAYNAAGSTTLPSAGSVSDFVIASNPGHGAVALSGSTVTYTPYAGYYGSDSFTFYANGPGGDSSVATVSVTVGNPPAPIAYNGSLSTAYNTATAVTLPASGVITAYGIWVNPTHGAVSLAGATATYTPDAGYYGTDSFGFGLAGPGGDSGAGTISVTVGNPPAPIASNGSLSTAYNTPNAVTLPASGVITAYGIWVNPTHGTVSLEGATATYTPNAGYYGADSFGFGLAGPGGDSGAGTISVTVGNPPAPIASNGSIGTPYNTAGSTVLTASGLVTSYALVTGPSHGAAVISGGTAVYTPNAGYYGSDSFTFHATGPGGNSVAASIAVSVGDPPAPTASNGAITTAYNTAASTTLAASGVITSYAVVTSPAHGTVALSGAVATYTPTSGYYGADSFTFHVTGPGGTSAAATVAVSVGAPPAPSALNGSLTAPYNTAATVTLPSSGAVAGYAIDTAPTHGAVALFGGVATYTPTSGYYGPDSFTFNVSGPGGVSSIATISVTVQAPPPPVANAAPLTCAYQTTCAITLTSTGVTSAYSPGTPATNGSCTISGDTLTYTPAFGAVGSDSCTIIATGPGGASAPATIYITNEPPPLPQGAGSATGAAIPSSGASIALCAAGQSASIPGLPGPPTGTSYDPNWCGEQALNIGQQVLQLQNQLTQITNLQSQVAAAQQMLQKASSDSTSAPIAAVNAQLATILQQATGIGFNSQTAGASFGAAYPASETTAGFNSAQLASAMQAWQTNTAQALQTSIAIQNRIAQSSPSITAAVHNAVTASNSATGPTAAHQATNQIIAAVSTQLAQLQDIIIAESQAYTAVEAAKQQSTAAAAATTAQTQAQTPASVTAAPGVSDTSHM